MAASEATTKTCSTALRAAPAHFRRLADRLARVSEDNAPSTSEAAATPLNVQSKRIQGTYIRQPVFLDGKGKNVQPPPFMRLDMAKSERPVELYRPFTISAMEPLLMLEFDEVLGTCFSASSGKSAQQPTRLAASQDLRTWNRRSTRWSM